MAVSSGPIGRQHDDSHATEGIAGTTDGVLLTLALVYTLAAVPGMASSTEPAVWALLLIPAGVFITRRAAQARAHHPSLLLRAGWPVVVAPLVYTAEVAVVAHWPMPWVDGTLTRADVLLGLHGGRPDWPLGTAAEEAANVVYASYYLIPAIALYVAWSRGAEALARLSLGLAATSLVCGVVWLALPSGGYHSTGSPTDAALGPATAFVRHVYSNNPHFAAAFPSQHVAHTAAVVAVLRGLGASRLLWLWVACMWASTVYGQYHFALDGLAGWLVGGSAGAWAVAAAPWGSVPAGAGRGRVLPAPVGVRTRGPA